MRRFHRQMQITVRYTGHSNIRGLTLPPMWQSEPTTA